MNKQEALKRIEAQKETIIELTGWAVFRYIETLIEQLDEPEKVKIPQFVADWIEQCKAKRKRLLTALLYTPEKVNSWVDNPDNQKLFARAWLDGYEVKKEKRYLVKLKGVMSNFMVLKHNINEDTWYMSNKINYTDLKAYHTKKQLEQAGFGEVFNSPLFEVKEVE